MYEAVKRYETYVARNKRLEGKGASSSTTQPKATGQTSGYKPRFHKTTAFAATIPEVEDNGLSHLSLHPWGRPTHKVTSRLKKMTKGCTSPVIWRRPYLMILFSN